MTDYTTLSGAQFQRAVGADPEKWAQAFIAINRDRLPIDPAERQAFMTLWFRDAMEAAVKASHDG